MDCLAALISCSHDAFATAGSVTYQGMVVNGIYNLRNGW